MSAENDTLEKRKKIILDFVNGPLRIYLTEETSFSRFKEMINETCGTNFKYSDLYPSYLFNVSIRPSGSIRRKFDHSSVCSWHKDWHSCDCGAFDAPSDTKWYSCAKCDAGYEDQVCTCEEKE